MNSRTLIPCLLLAASAAAVASDWRLYSIIELHGKRDLSFFENDGVTHDESGKITVWVKSLRGDDVDKINNDPETSTARAARVFPRINQGYVPPYAKLNNNSDPSFFLGIANFEDIATNYSVDMLDRGHIEIDCGTWHLRFLSMTVFADGKIERSSDAPLPWKDVPPDSIGDGLLKILCPDKPSEKQPAH